ncbi:MAG: acylphosphatase [Candidatus Marinimicrobia bacterium]|nr:acylphosphatase [Candidatus Neomarinimicrobiota bacterium]
MSFQTLKITISGRVQMVGFRWYAKQHADMLGIRGHVRNTSGGRVEILAAGETQALETFMDHLRAGPSRARVDDLKKEESNKKPEQEGFTITM